MHRMVECANTQRLTHTHTHTQIYINREIHYGGYITLSLTQSNTTELSAVTGNSLPTPYCNNYSFYSFLQLTAALLSMSSMQKMRASLLRPGGCREAGPLCQNAVCAVVRLAGSLHRVCFGKRLVSLLNMHRWRWDWVSVMCAEPRSLQRWLAATPSHMRADAHFFRTLKSMHVHHSGRDTLALMSDRTVSCHSPHHNNVTTARTLLILQNRKVL